MLNISLLNLKLGGTMWSAIRFAPNFFERSIAFFAAFEVSDPSTATKILCIICLEVFFDTLTMFQKSLLRIKVNFPILSRSLTVQSVHCNSLQSSVLIRTKSGFAIR